MANFTIDLNKWIAKAKENTETLVRETVIGLGERIVERTPVGNPSLWESPPPPGYVGGRARANWQYGFNSPPQGALDDIDKSGVVSLGRISKGAKGSPAAGIHYIANNLPYAQALENGHSTQAPSGMVRLAVVDMQGIVAEIVAGLK